MKLHLPLFLRRTILTLMLAYGVPVLHAAALTLGTGDSLSVDYSASGSLQDLNNGTLRLSGGTTLQLFSCGEGDGKTYTLLTGVSSLLGADGRAITLDDTNNAASLYFDTTQSGSGFWANGTLQLNAGALQLVLHDKAVKDAVAITSHQSNSAEVQRYAGVTYRDIESVGFGGAISAEDDSTIFLHHNGRLLFEGNSTRSSSSYVLADGGAIAGRSCTISFSNNGCVQFKRNVATSDNHADGGAISGSSSTISFSKNGGVLFKGNATTSDSYAMGGAIYGIKSTISYGNNGSVAFEGNSVTSDSYAVGGAIFIGDDSTISLSNNGHLTFEGNTASGSSLSYGGAMCCFISSAMVVSNNGSVVFEGNTVLSDSASYGGAIVGDDDSTIELSNNGNVVFERNKVSSSAFDGKEYGGAIYGGASSSTILSNNGCVKFDGNTASSGGAIYGDESRTITLSNNGSVNFIENTASSGGAIYGGESSTITLSNNESVDFCGNTGGAIYGEALSIIKLIGNVRLVLQDNHTSNSFGGAIFSNGGEIILSGNESLSFLRNSATESGGAVGGYYGASSEISNNTFVEFCENSAEYGAALYQRGLQSPQYVKVNDNGEVRFSNNTASRYGGAIFCGVGVQLILAGNGTLSFCDNDSAYGGAVYGDAECNVSFSNNGLVSFTGNEASLYGGAIGGGRLSTINLSDNEKLIFSDNTAHSEDNYARGGAIGSSERFYGSSFIEKNDSVAFVGNRAESEALGVDGGAIFSFNNEINNNKKVSFKDNVAFSSANWSAGGAIRGNAVIIGNGEVHFTGNKAKSGAISAEGGALFGWTFQLNDNELLEFGGNAAIADSADGGSAVATGGAIYAFQVFPNTPVERILSICNNGETLFHLNSEVKDGRYRLRSIYASDEGEGVVVMSAAAGKRIEFRDSIYIGTGNTFSLNEDFAESETSFIRQLGDIIFSGKYTEEHLNTLLAAAGAQRTATPEEILASRSSEVKTLTTLRGGRLRVEDDAIYQGQGVTVAAGSGAAVWLRNGKLQHHGYNITFGRGTTFGLRGSNITQSANIVMDEGSSLSFEIAAENISSAVLTHTGALTLGGYVTLNIGAAEAGLAHGTYKLLRVTDISALENWNNENLHVGGGSYAVSDLEWVGDTLCFNYCGQQLSTTEGSPYTVYSPDSPVTPDKPVIPDAPVTPVEPENPDALKKYRPGSPVLTSKDINEKTEVILTGKGNMTLEGKISAGAISVNTDKNLTFKSNKKNPGALSGSGKLTKRGNGTLTLNDGNSSWSGDTHLYAGTIKVKGSTSLGKGDVYVKGGTLNLGSKAIANDIVQSASAVIKSGKKFTGTYTLEKGELLKGSTLNIAKVATLEGGTVNGTLTGTGITTVTGKVTLGDKGKITTKALTLDEDATLTTSAKGLSSKATTLTIGENALFSVGGKMTVDSLKLNGGELKTTAAKPAAMTVKNNMELTGATLTTNGKVTTNKLTLNESTMTIKGAKAQNLTVKQGLTLGSGSSLRLNGKLSAGSLTIKSGGTLTMSGSKPVTLKVKGALTLNEGSSIILDYDFVQGKTYKLLTFGSYSGSSDYYSIFGVDADDCTITNTGKALSLTVTGKWNPQTQQKTAAAEAMVVSAAKSNPVADALVQANWGQLEASRAFVNAMANRSMAVQLGNGERAVWASAIGASSRHSSAGGHAGADTNVSGGAFGLETQVGRASLFGMALGNSWTRVSAHGFGTIEQDTTHLGLYGQTNWRSGVTADWSAAYGRSESESMGSEWNQKQLQLDGRVSYNHELNASSLLSPFAGVQYYSSDSAAIGTTDTGSLQNLRAEIGVAASHRVGKFGVYGEIAVHQDIARNNPVVDMAGTRCAGMNPGRTGLNFTVGASYELNDKWSVNASYTGEFVENANVHSANVGASYKF